MVPRQSNSAQLDGLEFPLLMALLLPFALVREPEVRVLVEEAAALRVSPAEGRLVLQAGNGRSLGAVAGD
ncbi:hypothetical protein AAF134_13720 [Synechococcus lacustris Tous-12m]